MLDKLTMLVCPSVPVWNIDGQLFFDRKFYDGILLYCASWLGTITVVMRIASTSPPEFGLVLYDVITFPAQLIILDKDKEINYKDISNADIVLASGDNYKNLHLSSLCKLHGIKCIYIIEYIFETRFQIIMMSDANFRQKIKSIIWNTIKEFKRRKAFALASGLQANGAPAFNAYKKLVNNTLLYFDSRNGENTNITEAELATRLMFLDDNAPLRLGFSGRLIKMKGADHLIEMAKILKKMDIPFTLDIFGAGDVASQMNIKISEYKLEKQVRLRGSVDFTEILLPFVKSNLDLFICCHRQSDPSCTYLETYACGVPIVGYDNRAHKGILDQVDVGWSIPMNDIKALANKVAYLNTHREEIKRKANNARQFSTDHTFEKTFNRRIEQCSMLAKNTKE